MLALPPPAPQMPGPGPTRSPRLRLYLLGAAVVLLVAILVAGTLGNPPAYDRSVVYSESAASDLGSAWSMLPAGYVQGVKANGTCGAVGCLSTASGTFGRPEELGSTGSSVRISVFNTTENAGAGYDAAVAAIRAKSGFVDISSSLGAYSGRGSCFGAGVGTAGGSTATVYCTKSNVFFSVTFESTLTLDGLKAEMPEVLGAVYSGIG